MAEVTQDTEVVAEQSVTDDLHDDTLPQSAPPQDTDELPEHLYLCCQTSKALVKLQNSLRNGSPSRRVVFKQLVPSLSVCIGIRAPKGPLEGPQTGLPIPLPLPDSVTAGQESKLLFQSVLHLQYRTPRKITLGETRHALPNGEEVTVSCSELAKGARAFHVQCVDGMAVSRLLLPVWAAALCNVIGCPPQELVVVPLTCCDLLIGVCSNPSSMMSLGSMALLEGGLRVVEGADKLSRDAFVISDIPREKSTEWMQWENYVGASAEIGFLTTDFVTQFPFPTTEQQADAILQQLKGGKAPPVMRTNHSSALKRNPQAKAAASRAHAGQQYEQQQMQKWGPWLWRMSGLQSLFSGGWVQQVKKESKMQLFVVGIVLIVVSQVLARVLPKSPAAV